MGLNWWSTVAVVVGVVSLVKCINGEDPYQFFTWNVTYGDIYPLGVKQQVVSLFIQDSRFHIFLFFVIKYLLVFYLFG